MRYIVEVKFIFTDREINYERLDDYIGSTEAIEKRIKKFNNLPDFIGWFDVSVFEYAIKELFDFGYIFHPAVDIVITNKRVPCGFKRTSDIINFFRYMGLMLDCHNFSYTVFKQ